MSFALAGLLALGPPPVAAAQEGSPAGPVPVEALETRRARLLTGLDGGVAVLGAARLRDIEGDYPQDSDFRQDNDFFYLTGLESPEAWLVVDGATGSFTLYMPDRDPAAERWTGPRPGPDAEVRALTGLERVRSSTRLGDELRSLLSRRATENGGGVLLISSGAASNGAALASLLEGLDVELRPLPPVTARLRLVKDADELGRLREAIAITAEAHQEVWRLAEPGMYEYELEAAAEYVFRARGAERVGFPSIVGSGPNSTVLHYDRSRRRTEAGDLVVVDMGAEFGYYTADLTRTFPVSGRFTPRQRALYDLVLGAQEAALARVRPGVTLAELNQVAREHLERASGDHCGTESCNRYFIHGLSHWLGMDVHDVGDYGTVLAPGMVLTIEPGLYLPDEPLGIRIEDDVLVTEDGHELLSGALPRDADEVEAIMREPPRWTSPVGRRVPRG
jgi:Xaa-Pro aminopeptidase